jgi:hypothetical protein
MSESPNSRFQNILPLQKHVPGKSLMLAAENGLS